jgi:hypothetical protein
LRGLLEQLDAMAQAGLLDAEGALFHTEDYLSGIAARASPEMRARWRWVPGWPG